MGKIYFNCSIVGLLWLFFFYYLSINQIIKCNDLNTQKVKINPVSCLLPSNPSSDPEDRVKISVKAYGGCFQWYSIQSDIIDIETIYDDDLQQCSSSCVITPKIAAPQTGQTVLIATDTVTFEELSCFVTVAPLARIEIETQSKSLNVEFIQMIKIKGFDYKSNVFSSLEGFPFLWNTSDRSIVEISKINPVFYQASVIQQRLENKGYLSDIILVKGLKTGTSKLSASLDKKYYPDIQKDAVTLTVYESVLIVPKKILLPPFCDFKFFLQYVSTKTTYPENVFETSSSSNYRWSLSSLKDKNDNNVNIDSKKGLVHISQHAEGDYTIFVEDCMTNLNRSESKIRVSKIAAYNIYGFENKLFLDIDLQQLEDKLLNPYDSVNYMNFNKLFNFTSSQKWYLVKGLSYNIGLEALNENKESIYLPNNFIFEVDCVYSDVRNGSSSNDSNESCVHIITKKSHSSRFLIIEPNVKGSLSLTVTARSLNELDNISNFYPLAIRQDVVIVDPVRVLLFNSTENDPIRENQFPPIILPLYHTWELEAVGGSGSYEWTSLNFDVVSIIFFEEYKSNNRKVKILSSDITGMSKIYVCDTKNNQNCFKFDVETSDIGKFTLDTVTLEGVNSSPLEIVFRAFPSTIRFSSEKYLSISKETIDLYKKIIATSAENMQSKSYSELQTLWQNVSNTEIKKNLLYLHFISCQNIEKLLKSPFDTLLIHDGKKIDGRVSVKECGNHPYCCKKFHVNLSGIEGFILFQLSSLDNQFQSHVGFKVYNPLSYTTKSDIPEGFIDSRRQINELYDHNLMVGSFHIFNFTGGPSPSSEELYTSHFDSVTTNGDRDVAHLHIEPISFNSVKLTCLSFDSISKVTLVRESLYPTFDAHDSNAKKNTSKSSDNEVYSIYSNETIPYSPRKVQILVSFVVKCSIPSSISVFPSHINSNNNSNHSITESNADSDIIFSSCYSLLPLTILLLDETEKPLTHWNTGIKLEGRLTKESAQIHTDHNYFDTVEKLSMNESTFSINLKECNSFYRLQIMVSLPLSFFRQTYQSLSLIHKPSTNQYIKSIQSFLADSNSRWKKVSKTKDTFRLMTEKTIRTLQPPEIYPKPIKTSVSAIYPFFYKPSLSRRIRIRYGSGKYFINLKPNTDKVHLFFSEDVKEYNLSLWRKCFDQVEEDILPSHQKLLSSSSHLDNDKNIRLSLSQINDCLNFTHNDIGHSSELKLEGDPELSTSQVTNDSFLDFLIYSSQMTKLFSIVIQDSLLIPQKNVSHNYIFSSLGRLSLSVGKRAFQSPSFSPVEIVTSDQQSDVTLTIRSNTILELNVTAYDSVYNIPFANSELSLINICLNEKKKKKSSVDNVRLSCLHTTSQGTQEVLSNDIFSSIVLAGKKELRFNTLYFQGLFPGLYELEAISHNDDSTIIVSNSIKMLVFDAIKFSPAQFRLLPGCHSIEFFSNKSLIFNELSNHQNIHDEFKYILLNEKSEIIPYGSNTLTLLNTDTTHPSILGSNSIGNYFIHVQWKDFTSTSPVSTDDFVEVSIDYPASIQLIKSIDEKRNINIKKNDNKVHMLQCGRHTLNVGVFNSRKELFTMAHFMVLPVYHKTSTDEKMTKISRRMHSSYVCTFEWTSENPSMVKFLKPSHIEHQADLLDAISGLGLSSVNILSLGTIGETNVRASVKCDQYHKLVTKESPTQDIVSFSEELLIEIVVTPSESLFHNEKNFDSLCSDKMKFNQVMFPVLQFLLMSFRYKGYPSIIRIPNRGIFKSKVSKEMTSCIVSVLNQNMEKLPIILPIISSDNNQFLSFDIQNHFFMSQNNVSDEIQQQSHINEMSELMPSMYYIHFQHPLDFKLSMLSTLILTPIHSASILSSIPTVGIGSTFEIYVGLHDHYGHPVMFPINYWVNSAVTHSSVLQCIDSNGENQSNYLKKVTFKALRQGCTAVTVSVVLPTFNGDNSEETLLAGTFHQCIQSTVLPYKSYLQVMPGASIQFLKEYHFQTSQKESYKLDFRIHLNVHYLWNFIFNIQEKSVSDYDDLMKDPCLLYNFIHKSVKPILPAKYKNYRIVNNGSKLQQYIKTRVLDDIQLLFYHSIFHVKSGWNIKHNNFFFSSKPLFPIKNINQISKCTFYGFYIDFTLLVIPSLLQSISNVPFVSFIENTSKSIWNQVADFENINLSYIDWNKGGIQFKSEFKKSDWNDDKTIPGVHFQDNDYVLIYDSGQYKLDLNIDSVYNSIEIDAQYPTHLGLQIVQETHYQKNNILKIIGSSVLTDLSQFYMVTPTPQTTVDSSWPFKMTIDLNNINTTKPLLFMIIPFLRDKADQYIPILSTSFISQNIIVSCYIVSNINESKKIQLKNQSAMINLLDNDLGLVNNCLFDLSTIKSVFIEELTAESNLGLVIQINSVTSLYSTEKHIYPLVFKFNLKYSSEFLIDYGHQNFIPFSSIPNDYQDRIINVAKKNSSYELSKYALRLELTDAFPLQLKVLKKNQISKVAIIGSNFSNLTNLLEHSILETDSRVYDIMLIELNKDVNLKKEEYNLKSSSSYINKKTEFYAWWKALKVVLSIVKRPTTIFAQNQIKSFFDSDTIMLNYGARQQNSVSKYQIYPNQLFLSIQTKNKHILIPILVILSVKHDDLKLPAIDKQENILNYQVTSYMYYFHLIKYKEFIFLKLLIVFSILFVLIGIITFLISRSQKKARVQNIFTPVELLQRHSNAKRQSTSTPKSMLKSTSNSTGFLNSNDRLSENSNYKQMFSPYEKYMQS